MKNAKFIIVKDKNIANKMILHGFQMVSQTKEMYTFMNTIPQHFNFDEIDIKKLVYTNSLVF